jgi:hypothetical protein
MPIRPIVKNPPREVRSLLVVMPEMPQATKVDAQIKKVEVMDDCTTEFITEWAKFMPAALIVN